MTGKALSILVMALISWGIVFVLLRLVGIIHWHWFWTMLPIFIAVGIYIIMVVLAVVFGLEFK